MDGNPARRPSLKARYPNWKEKLRENCLRRVREERACLLWKLRTTERRAGNEKENVKSSFKDIVADELQKIKQPCLINCHGISPSENDDLLWQYDGMHSNSDSNEGENEELLLEMERLLYEDLREESIRRELEVYEEEEDEYLARVLFEHMQLNDYQDDKVWCPICKQGELREAHHLIYCTHCKLRLDLENDKVNLNFLRDRLGEVHMEHLDRGCKATPTFCMETVFDLTALYVQCQLCGTFEVVL